MYDPLLAAVTIRRWGEPPLNGGFAILQYLNGEPAARVVAPQEVWTIQSLSLELKQQLWAAGAQQADLDAAAGNCITPPMGQTALLPFLSRAFLSVELLGMPSFSNWVPVAQAASTTCRSVIVLPMKLSLQSEHQFLVSQSHGIDDDYCLFLISYET